jgi:hypothetical protein
MTKSIIEPACSPCSDKPKPDKPEAKDVFTFGKSFAVQIVAYMENV